MSQTNISTSSSKIISLLLLHFWCLLEMLAQNVNGIIFFPRGGSIGYLAAVAMPLDIPNRNVYVAFNFESNYGLPSNDSYNEWIDSWNLDENFLGIGNNVTSINGRSARYTRTSFYRSFVGYLQHFQMNGTGCLLRTICEVAAFRLDENNGLLGSLFNILFMPTTSAPEQEMAIFDGLYEAEQYGRGNPAANCLPYEQWCPQGVINMISAWF